MARRKKVSPRSAPPRKPKSKTVRSRKHLTGSEAEAMIRAHGSLGRHRHRDATMILMAFRHGFRASELVSLRWDQVDFVRRTLHVRRVKRGSPSTHPLGRRELAALRVPPRLLRFYALSPVFSSLDA